MSPARMAAKTSAVLVLVRRSQAWRDHGRVDGQLEVGAVQTGDLPQAGVVDHSGDLVAVLRDRAPTPLLQDLAHRGRHRLVDLEPHGLAEAPAPELLLEREHQVVRLVLLELQVGVARDAEEVRLQDVHAGEEHVQVGGDDLLEQHELVRLDLEEARQERPEP